MLDAVKNYSQKVVEYSHSAGNESYRNKLTLYYQKHGIALNKDEILITTGGSEAIQMAFFTCLNEGDEVIVAEPYYANYNGFACLAGVKVVPVLSDIKKGFALPEIAAFEEKITPKTKAILICNPGNPTGYLYTKKEMEQIRDLVKKHDLFLFSDEVYKEFCYDGNSFTSAMHLDGIENHVILLDSVSKRYSACGIRIGAFITKNKEVYAAALKIAQARLSPPSFGQAAAEAAIETPDTYFKQVLAEYSSRRDLIFEAINKMPGAFCPKPQGAFYIIASLPIDHADKFCQWLLESFRLKNKTVMLAPASGFYANPGSGIDQVRIAYVLNKKELAEAMDCLAEALKVYPGRTNA